VETELIGEPGKFDVIYSTFSLHHWTNPALGIKNLYQSLNENGILSIYDFFRGGIFYYIRIKRGVWESIRASHPPEEIGNMLTELDIASYRINRKSLYMDVVVTKNSCLPPPWHSDPRCLLPGPLMPARPNDRSPLPKM